MNTQKLDFQNTLQFYISCLETTKCKSWSKVDEWTQSNFEELSKQIFTDTKQNISASTLKRLLRYQVFKRKPFLTNLNILAIYIGYSDWNEFTQKNYDAILRLNPNYKKNTVKKINVRKIVIFSLIPVFLFLTYIVVSKILFVVNPVDIAFSIEKSENKYPENIRIKYDINKVRFLKNAYVIVDYLNKKNHDTIRLDENNRSQKNEYLYFIEGPGKYFFNLIVNNKKIKQDSALSETIGWIAELNERNNPAYKRHFVNDSIIHNGTLNLNLSKIIQLQVNPNNLRTSYLYCNKNLEKIHSSQFLFEAKVKNEQIISMFGESKQVIFTISFSKGFISFNLVENGYTAHSYFLINDTKYTGKESSMLLPLCTKMSEWQTVLLKSSQNNLTVFINGKEGFQIPIKNNLGLMESIKIITSGMIDYVKAYNHNNTLVYYNDFN